MLNLKQILVPTDFSEPSENAVRYGRELAQTFDADSDLAHELHAVGKGSLHSTEIEEPAGQDHQGDCDGDDEHWPGGGFS